VGERRETREGRAVSKIADAGIEAGQARPARTGARPIAAVVESALYGLFRHVSFATRALLGDSRMKARPRSEYPRAHLRVSLDALEGS